MRTIFKSNASSIVSTKTKYKTIEMKRVDNHASEKIVTEMMKTLKMKIKTISAQSKK